MTEDHSTVGYEGEKKRGHWPRIVFVLSVFLLGLAAATQHFARRMGYHEALGPHYEYLYSPVMIAFWYADWGGKLPVEFRISCPIICHDLSTRVISAFRTCGKSRRW